jgi:hypothetical protein
MCPRRLFDPNYSSIAKRLKMKNEKSTFVLLGVIKIWQTTIHLPQLLTNPSKLLNCVL